MSDVLENSQTALREVSIHADLLIIDDFLIFVWHVVQPPDELILIFFNVPPVSRLDQAVDSLDEEKDYLRQYYFPLDIKVNFHIFELK